MPQEWHKKKVRANLCVLSIIKFLFILYQEDLFIFNTRFNLSHQVDCAGTIQNIKNSFGHNKATKDTSNFYPTWDLSEVCTNINLIGLVCHITGKDMNSSTEVRRKYPKLYFKYNFNF